MGVPSLQFHRVEFSELGITLPAAFDPATQRLHFPVATSCAAIEVDVRTQRPRLQREYAEHLARIRLPTTGGPQELLCIEYEALGLWLATIQTQRVSDRTRSRIRYFRAQVMAAASDILLGRAHPLTLDERRQRRSARDGDTGLQLVEGRVAALERAVFVGDPGEEDDAGGETRSARCPHCGRPIKVTVGDLRIVAGE